MANLVRTEKFTNTSDFIVAPDLAFAISAIFSDAGVTAGADGRKIIKAGTPIYVASGKNIFEERQEPVTVTSAGGTLVGIARHDVDVTYGNATMSYALLIKGVVLLDRLDASVQTALTSDIKTSLKNDIIFMKEGL